MKNVNPAITSGKTLTTIGSLVECKQHFKSFGISVNLKDFAIFDLCSFCLIGVIGVYFQIVTVCYLVMVSHI